MIVTVLGCGGAGGVPSISGGWGACDPDNPRNRRRRPSVLVETDGATLLIDTSPDLREQLLDAGVRRLDAVLYTHGHADHLHGIDDLREVNRAMRRPIDVFGDAEVLSRIRQRFRYAFEPLDTPYFYRPVLVPHEVDGPFQVGPIEARPFVQDHGTCTSLGFRFGDFAYSTDVVNLSEAAFAELCGVRVWIVGTLVNRPHETHAHVDKALDWIARIRPQRTFLTHMGTGLDYETLRRRLPEGVEPAYDGLRITV